MKTLWIKKKINYDGTQLRTLYAYLEHGVLGPSMISFRGACDVSFDHMIDGEDLREQSQICGKDMLHFIVEIFHENLFSGVLLQRMIASLATDLVNEKSKRIKIHRSGDDLYSKDKKKLSISIAASSVQSVMVHFAVNITNEGTPVKTVSLKDLGIRPDFFAKELMKRTAHEILSIRQATQKVRPLT